MAKADEYIENAVQMAGLAGLTDYELYENIYAIVDALRQINEEETIEVSTTGAISERLCKMGFSRFPELTVRRNSRAWKWIGDLMVPADPYDLAVSVKSFKAKERLLCSGSGSLLTPTVGWGLFDDKDEWSPDRVQSYLYRGFLCIYMPSYTLDQVDRASRDIVNVNHTPFLRPLEQMPEDVRQALIDKGIDKGRRLDTRKL